MLQKHKQKLPPTLDEGISASTVLKRSTAYTTIADELERAMVAHSYKSTKEDLLSRTMTILTMLSD